MPLSQNLRFTAALPEEADDHPPGTSLARQLSAKLTQSGWTLAEPENWRDTGWSIDCERDSAKLKIIISQIEPKQWMLQITPQHRLGFIGRLSGHKPSASPHEVHTLALAVHHGLSALQYLGHPQWRWDGPPNQKNSASEPQPA